MRWSISLLTLFSGLAAGAASPADFGRGELLAAIEARALKPERFKVITEHSMVLPPDGFSIMGNLIRGGNLRGIMYGLLEAAALVRKHGGLRPAKGGPALAVRGVRWAAPLPDDPVPLFQTLARARFNRFVAAHPSTTVAELRKAADAAASHGLDFGVVASPGSSPQALISAIPQLKFIEADPNEANLAEITRAGRLLTLDLDGTRLTEDAFEAARASRLPLQVIVRPGRFGDFLRKPEVSERSRPWQVIWRLEATSGVSPKTARAAVPWLGSSQAQGFEIELRSPPGPLFLEIWGRLSYNPAEQDSLFLSQLNVKPPKDAEILSALDAAALVFPFVEDRPLLELLDEPLSDSWRASPNEAARLRLRKESSAKELPLERVSLLLEAARKLESASPTLKDFMPIAVQARIIAHRLAAADHLAWASATGDVSALSAARREAESALALAPESPLPRRDLDSLSASQVATSAAPIPERHPGVVTRPALEHLPPRRAFAGQPLVLAIRIWPQTNIERVRLHWRPRRAQAPWQMIEAGPSRATFTLPPNAITPAHDIEYYFEVLHNLGSGWFLPGPLPGLGWGAFVAETAPPAAQ